MAIRPGRCYSKIKGKPWTRISKRRPRRSYVKGVPVSKIHQFEMGNVKGDFDLTLHLVLKEERQLRSNSLEAARVAATKYLSKKMGEQGFFLKVLVYPHHVLRENPMATGAGADRFSEGMRRSFGKPIGQAARVWAGQNVLMVKVPKEREADGKMALKKASDKLTGTYTINIKEGK